jgi:hypothetical protein
MLVMRAEKPDLRREGAPATLSVRLSASHGRTRSVFLSTLLRVIIDTTRAKRPSLSLVQLQPNFAPRRRADNLPARGFVETLRACARVGREPQALVSLLP